MQLDAALTFTFHSSVHARVRGISFKYLLCQYRYTDVDERHTKNTTLHSGFCSDSNWKIKLNDWLDCIYYLSCVAQNVCLLFALRVSECLDFELKPRGFKATNDKEQMLCFCFCSVSSTLLIIFHHSQEFENASKAYGALEQKSPLFDTCNTWWCWWEKHMHPTQI